MEKGKTMQLGLLVTAFMAILLGIILTQTIGDTSNIASNTRTITDAQYTFSNDTSACTVVSTGNCISSVTLLENTTGTAIPASNYSICRHGGNPDGIQIGPNQAAVTAGANGKSVNITYQQSVGCMYIEDSGSRSLMNLNTLWFALAVVLVGIALYMKIKEDYF